MLTGAVHTLEGLFMQQTHHAVLSGDALHQLHGELIVVGGDVDGGEDRRQLVLCGSDLIVLGLGIDAQLPQLLVQLRHERLDALFDRAEVVVVELLTLGRTRAEEGASGIFQILAAFVNILVDQKVFLLGADSRVYAGDVGLAEEVQDPHALVVDAVHRAQQGGLFVQHIAGIGHERGGDAQGVVLDERGRGGIPCGIAARFKGGADTARGEGGRVGLALDELLARELHDDMTVRVRGDEAVVLLGSDAGHRLEPVGVVGTALFDRPLLHRVGNGVRDLEIERNTVLDALTVGVIYILRQSHAHLLVVKYI